jgi:SAM-dependent methyltransferase
MTNEEFDVNESFEGVCTVCGTGGSFRRTNIRTRETFTCANCRGSLRYQAQADAILKTIGAGETSLAALAATQRFAALRIYEVGIMGPFRKILSGIDRYTKSFYWDDVAPGDARDGVQCQDLHKLTFPDESFDLVISSDIFEHVRRPFVAFSEVRRVLRPGGHHIFSIPSRISMPPKTIFRVDTSTETDIHVLPEVYHGSGVAGGRSLVYTDFGLDMLDTLKMMGFPTEMSLFKPPGLEQQVTFVSVKD